MSEHASDEWAVIQQSLGGLEACPFCGKDKPVLITTPVKLGIQCSNQECLALVYVDYTDKIGKALSQGRKYLSDEEYREILVTAAQKWNRRQK
ncbi:MAG: hypothetical protein IJQ56_07470 [Synergistaceae bacterium]|nr:hypothetical protein [Synergistaceae bacterium]